MMIMEVILPQTRLQKKSLALQRCHMRWVEASTAACPHGWTPSILIPQLSRSFLGSYIPSNLLLPHELVGNRPH